MVYRALFFLTMIATLSPAAKGADVSFASNPARTHLLELFTSEGCSSCPPAEAWLSKLKNEPRLWRDFVPMAFHVDYWDRLGWRDPFASKQWTARQYDYSSRWQSSSVYTPGFVLDGREWRERSVPGAGKDDTGVLSVAVKNKDVVSASFASPGSGSKALEVHVARLGFDLNINVKAGENNGRKLLHDFVVLSLATERMTGGKAELRLLPSAAKPETTGREAIAVWITEAGQAEPLQAAGSWL